MAKERLPRIEFSTYTTEVKGDVFLNGYVISEYREVPIKVNVTKLLREHTCMAQRGVKRRTVSAITIVL